MSVLYTRDKDGKFVPVPYINGKGGGSTYPSVKDYKAKGDGNADDTKAFQDALAENRVVFVPGGTYKLSGELVIGENCCLELSQDAVLNFTQTEGNCITLGMSSMLKGNHATVFVPYGFSGHVVHASATTATSQAGTPPWSKWDPQWKSGRYLTDLNICKRDTRGFHYSMGDTCKGTAVYIESDGASTYAQKFIWGLNYAGLRIAGAFAYGIHGVCKNGGWMHEMRIDAFMDACETGVCLEDCNNVYLSAVVQPRKAYTTDGSYVPYAKQGIRLVRCKNTDLSGSRVWDWDADKALWTSGGENQHIAMYGDCRGTILNDYLYYSGSADIRDIIYTDTPYNLEAINILQEPITRWFKPKDNEPYFFNGNGDQRLALKEEVDEYFQTDRVPGFTDALANAIDADGNIYNGVGHKAGVLVGSQGDEADNEWHWSTGYISCEAGDTLRAQGLFLKEAYAANSGMAKIVYYDKDFKRIWSATAQVLNPANAGTSYSSYYQSATLTDDGFEILMKSTLVERGTVAYVRLTLRIGDVGADPVISINDEIKFSQAGFLADNIKVKAQNVVGGNSGGGAEPDWNASEGEPGHVKNRTHYSTYTDAVFLDNVEIPMNDETIRDIPLVAGEIYRVVMNGTEYTETAYAVELGGMAIVALGNGSTVGMEDVNADIPFTAFYAPDAGGAMVSSLTGNESDVFTITGRQETVHKIPAKYLPDMTPYYVLIMQNGDGYICLDTPAKVKVAYDSGRQLICKEQTDDGFSFYQMESWKWADNGSVVGFSGRGKLVSLVSLDGETYSVSATTTS